MLKTLLMPGLVLLLQGIACDAGATGLFDSDATLEVVIEAPIATLETRRKEATEYSGMLRYTDEQGQQQALSLAVSTRGRSRLDMCEFPPLKLVLDRKETEGTLFAGQRKLKLVTKCLRKGAATDWLFLEMGIYRAYNAITPYSYRVRSLLVTYRDSGSNGREQVHPAFLIEPDEQLATRLGRERVRPPEVHLDQLSPGETTHNLLFQYLIGNTDFSVKRGPSGEGCCHNGRVMAVPGQSTDFVVVPFDFDQTGMVGTDYGLPDRRLGISKVRTRLYRGFCRQNEYLDESIERFNAKRADIEAALLTPDISKRQTRRVRRYVNVFYATINDPEELQKRILDECRLPDSQPLRVSPGSPSQAAAE